MASSSWCVIKIAVEPHSRASARKVSRSSAAVTSSRWPNARRQQNVGCTTKARAIATLWRMPPGKLVRIGIGEMFEAQPFQPSQRALALLVFGSPINSSGSLALSIAERPGSSRSCWNTVAMRPRKRSKSVCGLLSRYGWRPRSVLRARSSDRKTSICRNPSGQQWPRLHAARWSDRAVQWRSPTVRLWFAETLCAGRQHLSAGGRSCAPPQKPRFNQIETQWLRGGTAAPPARWSRRTRRRPRTVPAHR